MVYGQTQQHKKIDTRGFTLVELMVSLTIFSIVILVSVSTLLVMVDVNAKAQALYSATTNLSFALDSLTREFRTGFDYYCKPQDGNLEGDLFEGENNSCEDGDFLAFTRQKDNFRVGYRLRESGDPDDEDYEKYIEQSIENASGNTVVDWSRITSRDVVIDEFQITIENSDPYSDGDQFQPVGTLVVKGHVANGLDTDTTFNIQTRIVQRVLDVR